MKDRKISIPRKSETEDSILYMSGIDFHSRLNKKSILTLKESGFNFPKASHSITMNKDSMRAALHKRHIAHNREKLNFTDVGTFITDL